MGSKRDAELFEADITRRKRLGQLAQIDAGRQTVAEFAREWWRIHAEPNLATRTRETYAAVFDKHILPRVGGLALRDVTPAVVAGLSADMQAAGVGPAATRKSLMVLQGIFSCAVNWGHVPNNPVVGVRKPSAKRKRAVTPPSPTVVERMRGELLAAGQVRDATLVSVLAYAGLRPQEALGLPWSNVRGRTLLIDRAQSDEGLEDTKTGGTRSVRLLAPLVADLAAWRLASERSGVDDLVFPTAGGELWRDHDWANWRRRVFDPLAATLGVSGMRPYDLRHAFCSLLIGEGMSVVEVARQAGHAPTMTLATYAHVIADLDGGERVPAEASIRAAREAEVSASGGAAACRERKSQ
jgi:integrase